MADETVARAGDYKLLHRNGMNRLFPGQPWSSWSPLDYFGKFRHVRISQSTWILARQDLIRSLRMRIEAVARYMYAPERSQMGHIFFIGCLHGLLFQKDETNLSQSLRTTSFTVVATIIEETYENRLSPTSELAAIHGVIRSGPPKVGAVATLLDKLEAELKVCSAALLQNTQGKIANRHILLAGVLLILKTWIEKYVATLPSNDIEKSHSIIAAFEARAADSVSTKMTEPVDAISDEFLDSAAKTSVEEIDQSLFYESLCSYQDMICSYWSQSAKSITEVSVAAMRKFTKLRR